MIKKIILFIITWLILSATTKAQTQSKKDTTHKVTPTPKTQITDSTLFISINDVKAFNEILKKNYSYETYINMKPENVLSELVNWKIKLIYSKP